MNEMFHAIWKHSKRVLNKHYNRLAIYLRVRKNELRGTDYQAFPDGPRHPLP